MDSSCLMLMTSLYTAVDLDYVIDEGDLADDGIEEDNHITIFYANDLLLPKENMLSDMKEFLGSLDYENLQGFLKSEKIFPIYDILGLDKFENPDYDVLIMRLKEGNKLYKMLKTLNAGFIDKYGIKSDFDSYNPHMTISYLRTGVADKYLSDSTLDKVLKTAKVSYDDIMFSHKLDGDDKYKNWYLTSYNCIERHFRKEKLLKYKLKNNPS